MTQKQLSRAMLPWSTATLESFTTCPYRYYRLKVKKDVELPDNPAVSISRRLHEAFNMALSEDEPLPNNFQRFVPLINHLKSLPGEKRVSFGLGVDSKLKPCDFGDAWAWSLIDFAVARGNESMLFSWRTGNYEPSDQLRLSAAIYFAHNVECEILHTRTFWFRNHKVEKETYTRKDIPELWKTFVGPYHKWKKAMTDDSWEPTPCGLCNKYCGLKDCKYCLG